MKKRSFISRIVIVTFFVSTFCTKLSANEYALIVNTKNAYTASSDNMKREARLLFLKEKNNWPNGKKAQPLGSDPSSKEYAYFIDNILNMSTADLAQHWLKKKQISGNTPPREYKSNRILLKLVAKYEGGFAIINLKDAEVLPDGTRVLFNF